MNKKIIILFLLQAIAFNLCSMDIPELEKEALEQSDEKPERYFDTLSDEQLFYGIISNANRHQAQIINQYSICIIIC